MFLFKLGACSSIKAKKHDLQFNAREIKEANMLEVIDFKNWILQGIFSSQEYGWL